jgi:hypothetical protein
MGKRTGRNCMETAWIRVTYTQGLQQAFILYEGGNKKLITDELNDYRSLQIMWINAGSGVDPRGNGTAEHQHLQSWHCDRVAGPVLCDCRGQPGQRPV